MMMEASTLHKRLHKYGSTEANTPLTIPPARLNLKTLDVRPLKIFAHSKLHQGSALRELILTEKDRLSYEEYLVKMEVWLKLLKREFK